MRLIWTSESKVMTISTSREVPLFNFERVDILCLQIKHPFEKIGPFEFLDSFRCTISSGTIYNDPESDIRVKSYDHLNFSRASVVQFCWLWYIMRLNRSSVWKVMTIWISREVSLFNFGVTIYNALESEIRVNSYDHFNFSRGSIVQFPASRYNMSPNQTSVWEDRTIWISRQLPLYYFERHDI